VRCSLKVGALLLALGASAPLVGHGAPPDACAVKTFGERFVVRYRDRCWQQDEKLKARARSVEDAFGKADHLPAGRIDVAKGQVAGLAATLPTPQDQPASAPHLENLSKAVAEAQANLSALPELGRIDDAGGATYRALQLGYWDPYENARRGFGEQYLHGQNCQAKDASDQNCARIYAKAVEIGDAMFLMQLTVEVLRLPLRSELQAALQHRKARWNSYLYDSQFQYFWELGLNRWLEESCPKGLNAFVSDLLDREKECEALARDPHGNPLDWREPPSFRAIALHPDIGFMYDQNDPKGSRTNVTLVFQWFGYQWWKWDEESNKVKDLWGLSIVSTVTDNAVGQPVGLGLQIQYGKYSFAATSHGGKPIYTLSLNLLDRLSTLDEKAADLLRRRIPGGQ
jgi:hypothetical protein